MALGFPWSSVPTLYSDHSSNTLSSVLPQGLCVCCSFFPECSVELRKTDSHLCAARWFPPSLPSRGHHDCPLSGSTLQYLPNWIFLASLLLGHQLCESRGPFASTVSPRTGNLMWHPVGTQGSLAESVSSWIFILAPGFVGVFGSL